MPQAFVPTPQWMVEHALNDGRKAAFLAAYVSTGGNLTQAIQYSGIHRSTHYVWLKRDPKYRDAFAEAQQQADDFLEAEGLRRAFEGVRRPVYYKGKVIDWELRYSDAILIAMLRRRSRKKAGQADELEHTDQTTHLIASSPDVPPVIDAETAALAQKARGLIAKLYQKDPESEGVPADAPQKAGIQARMQGAELQPLKEEGCESSAPVSWPSAQVFPKWKYHACHEPAIVKSSDEEAALGEGWQDLPVPRQVGKSENVGVESGRQIGAQAAVQEVERPPLVPTGSEGEGTISLPVVQEFPKWKYHACHDPVIVKNGDEEAALGEEWRNFPVPRIAP